MQEKHNINLKPLELMKKLDIEKLQVYNETILKHIKNLELSSRDDENHDVNFQRVKNYQAELEKIIQIRKQNS
jgi:adenylate kinase family enzyme